MIQITYASLVALINAENLSIGQRYQITDIANASGTLTGATFIFTPDFESETPVFGVVHLAGVSLLCEYNYSTNTIDQINGQRGNIVRGGVAVQAFPWFDTAWSGVTIVNSTLVLDTQTNVILSEAYFLNSTIDLTNAQGKIERVTGNGIMLDGAGAMGFTLSDVNISHTVALDLQNSTNLRITRCDLRGASSINAQSSVNCRITDGKFSMACHIFIEGANNLRYSHFDQEASSTFTALNSSGVSVVGSNLKTISTFNLDLAVSCMFNRVTVNTAGKLDFSSAIGQGSAYSHIKVNHHAEGNFTGAKIRSIQYLRIEGMARIDGGGVLSEGILERVRVLDHAMLNIQNFQGKLNSVEVAKRYSLTLTGAKTLKSSKYEGIASQTLDVQSDTENNFVFGTTIV